MALTSAAIQFFTQLFEVDSDHDVPPFIFSYTLSVLPYVAPYLLPATNTLMTCSVYATVAVAVNRSYKLGIYGLSKMHALGCVIPHSRAS